MGRPGLDELNGMAAGDFARALDGVFEHAPWVAARAAAGRPYGSVEALHAGLMAAVRAAGEEERRRFLNGHPELAAGALPAGLTEASRQEQGGAGLGDAAGAEEVSRLNAAYRARHGIPFMICLRRHTAADVLRRFRARLERGTAEERAAALDEVGHVSRLRLAARVAAPDAAPPRGALVLRVEEPAPEMVLEAEGVAAGTWRVEGKARLLEGEAFRAGHYALRIAGAVLPFAIRDPGRDLCLRLLRGPEGWRLEA